MTRPAEIREELDRVIRVGPGPRIAAAIALLFALAGLVLFAHPYRGIEHDAILYALQALRHLNPQALGDDLFFRHGSQDAYTLFPPAYAWLIQLIGLEPAARLIARFSLLALFAAALLLARRMMDRDFAWLALALFIAIPGSYGADNVLKYAENFATPRTLTEALVLFALAMLVAGRRGAAWTAIGAGCLLHPLMAFPGLIACALLQAGRKFFLALLATSAAAVLLMILISAVAPFGPIRFIDPHWHESLAALVPYLLLEHWSISDWQPTVVGLATLVTAIRVLPQGLSNRLATVGAVVGASGIALAGIAAVAPVALLVQGQAWRWMWLGKAVAVLLLVPVAIACWRRGSLARAALMLLGVAWFARNDTIGVIAGLMSLLALTVDAGDVPPARRRAITWLFLLLAALLALAKLKLQPMPIELLLVAVITAVWWLVFRARRLELKVTGLAVALGLAGLQLSGRTALLVDAAAMPHYGTETQQSFSPWRDRIGQHETVFFPERPEMVWLVLNRKSYAAYAAPVFSRDAALETKARFDRIAGLTTSDVMPGATAATDSRSLKPEGALQACELDEIDFVVTKYRLPAPSLESTAHGALAGIRLYACPDLRAMRRAEQVAR